MNQGFPQQQSRRQREKQPYPLSEVIAALIGRSKKNQMTIAEIIEKYDRAYQTLSQTCAELSVRMQYPDGTVDPRVHQLRISLQSSLDLYEINKAHLNEQINVELFVQGELTRFLYNLPPSDFVRAQQQAQAQAQAQAHAPQVQQGFAPPAPAAGQLPQAQQPAQLMPPQQAQQPQLPPPPPSYFVQTPEGPVATSPQMQMQPPPQAQQPMQAQPQPQPQPVYPPGYPQVPPGYAMPPGYAVPPGYGQPGYPQQPMMVPVPQGYAPGYYPPGYAAPPPGYGQPGYPQQPQQPMQQQPQQPAQQQQPPMQQPTPQPGGAHIFGPYPQPMVPGVLPGTVPGMVPPAFARPGASIDPRHPSEVLAQAGTMPAMQLPAQRMPNPVPPPGYDPAIHGPMPQFTSPEAARASALPEAPPAPSVPIQQIGGGAPPVAVTPAQAAEAAFPQQAPAAQPNGAGKPA